MTVDLKVVEKKPVFFLFDGEANTCATALTPYDAILQFALTPELWPDDVDFWLEITHQTDKLRALGGIPVGMKRVRWQAARGLRRTSLNEGYRTFSKIDFWFFGKVLAALFSSDFQILDEENDETIQPSDLWLPIARWEQDKIVVNREGRYAHPLLILDERVQSSLGFEYNWGEK